VDAVKIDSAQNVTVSAGNLVIGTSGKGIDFSATAGTGTSELLSDYEEGTWTPAITYSVSNGDLSYASGSQQGHYTKVGRLVTVEISLVFSENTADGVVTIQNLPFVAASLTSTTSSGAWYSDNMVAISGTQTWLIPQNGGTLMLFRYSGTGTASELSNLNTTGSNCVLLTIASYYSA
jgi:hypothetical protein